MVRCIFIPSSSFFKSKQCELVSFSLLFCFILMGICSSSKNAGPESNVIPKCINCELCGTAKSMTWPKTSDMASKRDTVSMELIDIARGYMRNDSCIINTEHTRSFIAKYIKMRQELGSNSCICPKIVYHWTNPQNFDKIKEENLKVPDGKTVHHVTDDGYYGKGIYTSNDPRIAQSYGHGGSKVFVCLSITGKMYPATYPKDKGIGLQSGYDSHYNADNIDGPADSQWVFFDSSQLLLIYLTTLEELQSVQPILDRMRQYIQRQIIAISKSQESIPNSNIIIK